MAKVWRHGQPESGAVTLIADNGGASRVIWQLPSGVIVEQWNPAGAGDIIAARGGGGLITRPAGASILMPALAWFAPAQIIAGVGAGRYRAVDLGRDSRSGKVTELVELVRMGQGGAAALGSRAADCDLRIDPATGLPASATFRVRPYRALGTPPPAAIRERLGLEEVRYSDYRSVGGRAVPFHIQAFMGAKPIFDIILTAAVFDQGRRLGPLS